MKSRAGLAASVVALVVAAVIAAIVVGGWLTQPKALEAPVSRIALAGNAEHDLNRSGADGRALDTYLADVEASVSRRSGIVPGAEKRIVWAGGKGERSEFVVVYLHGFSATRQEIAPVPERVASALDANLFETRLAGHGLQRDRIEGVHAEDWLADGAEALAVARRLGERIVLMGTSTGATLALALARHPDFARVDGLVLLSPNWGPAAEGAYRATGPYGPQLIRLFAGAEHAWEAANDEQERYWTTRYPTAAIVEMMRLVDLASALTPEVGVPRAMLVYSPHDDVVSIDRLTAGFEALPAGRKVVHRIDEPESLSRHVLAGDILAPAETQRVADRIVDFLRNRTATAPGMAAPGPESDPES